MRWGFIPGRTWRRSASRNRSRPAGRATFSIDGCLCHGETTSVRLFVTGQTDVITGQTIVITGQTNDITGLTDVISITGQTDVITITRQTDVISITGQTDVISTTGQTDIISITRQTDVTSVCLVMNMASVCLRHIHHYRFGRDYASARPWSSWCARTPLHSAPSRP